MLVSDRFKLLFVHIPKTGGSTIRHLIWTADDSAYTYKRHHAIMTEEDADKFKDYYKFTVVRNSYKMCASLYRYMTEKIGGDEPTKGQLREREMHAKFAKPHGLVEFLKAYKSTKYDHKSSIDWELEREQETMAYILKNDPYPSQLEYFSHEGNILVDDVYQYDRGLDNELKWLRKKYQFDRIRLNYFGDYDWKSYYNDESIEYVKQICQKDIEYFDFKFDD